MALLMFSALPPKPGSRELPGAKWAAWALVTGKAEPPASDGLLKLVRLAASLLVTKSPGALAEWLPQGRQVAQGREGLGSPLCSFLDFHGAQKMCYAK